MILRLSAVAAALATVFSAPVASADTPRDYLFGGSFGRGGMAVGCNTCADVAEMPEGLSLSFYAGKMITPRLAVTADYWQVRFDGRDNRLFGDSADHQVNQTMMTIGAKLWLTQRFWFSGGVGIAHHDTDSLHNQTRASVILKTQSGQPMADPGSSSPAMVSGIGFEVARNSAFAVDIQFRTGAAKDATGLTVTNSALTFGLNWY